MMALEALWLRLHCLLVLPAPIVFPQHFLDHVRIAFLSRPEVPDEANSPGNRVGHYVGQLDARSQVTMGEQWFWQNLAGPLTTSRGELEVPIHLLNQEVALDSLEKIRIVLTQVVTARGGDVLLTTLGARKYPSTP